MKSLMRKLLGQGSPGSVTVKPAGGRDSPHTIEDGSENATRRQLVQVLLRDAVRKHGLPPGWIDCQMLVVASRSRGPGVYLRLVLKHWDERFIKYMPAFQNALLADIERFEPKAAEWLHGISWQLEVGDSCPQTTMPDKAYWVQPKRPPPQVVVVDSKAPASSQGGPSSTGAGFQVTQPFEESNAQRDLEALFAIRDQELSRHAADGHAPVGYEKTQPSPL